MAVDLSKIYEIAAWSAISKQSESFFENIHEQLCEETHDESHEETMETALDKVKADYETFVANHLARLGG